MGRVALVAAVALVLVLALIWLARAPARAAVEASAEPVPEAPSAAPTALAEPSVVAGGAAEEAYAERASARTPSEVDARRVRVRGRVIERRTGRALGGLGLGLQVVETRSAQDPAPSRAVGRTSIVPLGPGGSFELEAVDPERALAFLVEAESGVALESAGHRSREELQPDGTWLLQAEVGYFARLELVARLGVELAPESALLTEVVAGETQDWPRDELAGRPAPFVRHAAAAFEPDATHRRVLAVSASDAQDETWRGWIEVPAQNGFQLEPLQVVLQPPTFARGRVLDERGEPWAGAVVELLRGFDELAGVDADDLWEETDEDGAFDFSVLAPGEYRLRVCAAFTRGPSETVAIRPGANDLGTLVLARGGERGSVSGVLVTSAGDGGEDPFALVTLRDPQSGLEYVSVAGFELFQDPDGQAAFEFPGVPRGSYELTVLPMDALRYPSEPLVVQAPAAGIRIAARAADAASYALRLSGPAGSLAPDGVLFLRQGRWIPIAPAADDVLVGYAGEPLVVGAAGHRPRRVDPRESAAREGDALVIDVALEPGFGRAILVRDLSAASIQMADDFAAWCGPPLAEVRVLADGREAARSDATGLALLEAERAPARITFELAGYRTVSSSVDEGVQLVLMVRE